MKNRHQPQDSQSEDLSQSIARLRRAMRRAARIADPNNPLSVAQLELLSALVENPGIRPGNLARILHLQPNSTTTIVNGLYEKQMVRRVRADKDGRAFELYATDAGIHAVRKWGIINTAILDQALVALTSSQRDLLVSAVPSLDAIAQAINSLDIKKE